MLEVVEFLANAKYIYVAIAAYIYIVIAVNLLYKETFDFIILNKMSATAYCQYGK